ncbi:MAG: aminotransferase class I/II-fold pyridoxal phosphate-dependent enzyme [Acidobacteria bacterium]|nr:aminotransferase class I/II-fold pyridoxal phosphate-dependent enzyme [Acidobacteriota bacterium]
MQLSERIGRISESATMAVTAEAGRLKAEGVDVIAFAAGEPDFPTPTNIKDAAKKALDDNFTRYTPAGGIPALKKAVVEWHAASFGTNYEPSECLITVGGKHAIFNVMAAMIERGDEVALPVPYWVTFYDVVNYHGGSVVRVETTEADEYRLTSDLYAAKLSDKTKIAVVNSPNNPSGAVVDQGEFEKIYEAVVARGGTLMTDECYCKFVYDGKPYSIASLPGAKENVVVVGSLSKTFAMTGWRIGFALGPKPLIKAINNLQSHSTSNPTSIAQKAALAALTGPQEEVDAMLAEYRRRRDYIVPALNAIPGVTCPLPGGAFYAYPNISSTFGKSGIESGLDFATRLLREEHVAVVPGEAFGTENEVRISYAASMDDIKEGVERISRFIQKL